MKALPFFGNKAASLVVQKNQDDYRTRRGWTSESHVDYITMPFVCAPDLKKPRFQTSVDLNEQVLVELYPMCNYYRIFRVELPSRRQDADTGPHTHKEITNHPGEELFSGSLLRFCRQLS